MAQSVAFLGLGNMGEPMARNLLKAGYAVTVYNRSPERAQALVAEGAILAPSPAAAVKPGGIAITMLSDDAVLKAMALGSEGFIRALGAGLHISMSTVGPDTNLELARAQEALGGALVAAPVFGRPEAAAAAKLFIPVSGPAPALARALPILQLLGQRVQAFGEDVAAASRVKLCGNYLLLAATQAMAECMAVAQASGLERAAVMDFFTSTFLASPSYKAYGTRVALGDFSPGGFKLSLAAKDLRLFAQQPGAAGLPLQELVNQGLARAMQSGQGGLDATALALRVEGKQS